MTFLKLVYLVTCNVKVICDQLGIYQKMQGLQFASYWRSIGNIKVQTSWSSKLSIWNERCSNWNNHFLAFAHSRFSHHVLKCWTAAVVTTNMVCRILATMVNRNKVEDCALSCLNTKNGLIWSFRMRWGAEAVTTSITDGESFLKRPSLGWPN